MKTLFCWFMMLAATGSAQCSKDLKMAVLNKLDGKFENYNYLSIWMSEDYSVEHWRHSRLNKREAEKLKSALRFQNHHNDQP